MRKSLDFGDSLIGLLLNLLLAASKCAVKTYMMHNDPARYSWYNVWSAATAVMSMCVARGKNGKAIMDGTIIEPFSLYEFSANTMCSWRYGDESTHSEAWSATIFDG